MDRSWKMKLLRRLAPVVASAALASCSGRSDSVAVECNEVSPGSSLEVAEIPLDYFTPPMHVLPGRVRAAELAAERALYEPRLRRLPATEHESSLLALLPPIHDPQADAEALAQFADFSLTPTTPAKPLAPIEPLAVPAVDLSDAIAAVARPNLPATPAALPASASPRPHVPLNTPAPSVSAQAVRSSRWSEQLRSAEGVSATPPAGKPSERNQPSLFTSHAPVANDIARLPVLTETPSRSRVAEVAARKPVVETTPAPAPARSSPLVLGAPQFAGERAPVESAPPAATPAPRPVAPVVELPVARAPEPSMPTPEEMAMRAVRARAEEQIRHAFALARRGAIYSAKAELVEVLRTTTQALDMRDGTNEHSDALARAFRALDEAGDFQRRGTGLESNLDLEMLVAAHQTPVLKEIDLAKVTPLAALQRYYTYAQQQFAIAGGEQPTASAALYGLGRLQSLTGGPQFGSAADDAPQAMVFHQAAVLIDGANYKSANELGVLLARYGQYPSAREMLIHSVRVSPQVQSWQNLAAVHEKLGEMDLARRAMHESQLVASGQSGVSDADSPIRWVPPEALARSAPQGDDALISPVSNRISAPAEPQSREVRGIMQFMPWTRGRE